MIILLIFQDVPWKGIREIEISVDVVLGIMGLLFALFAAERALTFTFARRRSQEFADRIRDILRATNWAEAIRVSKAYSNKSHIARVVLGGLEEREALLAEGLPSDLIIKHMEERMERETLTSDYKFKRGLGVFDSIGGTAPFVGILGGSAYTFAFGTALAVPAIFLATYFRNRTLRYEVEMKNAASEVVTYVELQMNAK